MSGPNLRYPFKNIDRSDDYLKIEVLEYIPPGLNTSLSTFVQPSSDTAKYPTSGSKNIRGTIILPIPEGIQDGNAADWSSGSMGPLESVGMGVALGTIKSENPFSGFADSATKALTLGKNAAKTGTTQKMIQQFFAAKAVEQLTGGDRESLFKTSLARESGAVFNENIELLFNGVVLRPGYSFQFDMVPRSKRESDEIKNIIRLFKSEMAARKGLDRGDASGLFLKSPSVFRVEYMSGGRPHPFLNKFKISALKGMSVNYTASGTYATYSDATPVHIQMTLEFQELTPIYNEDYVDNNGRFKLEGTGY